MSTKQPLGAWAATSVLPTRPPALNDETFARAASTAARVTAFLSRSGPYTLVTAVWNSTPAAADSTPV